jgi:hypothetical protein
MTRQEALEILLEIDTSTVIDDNWGDFIEPKVVEALCKYTNLNSYDEVLEYYEGWYIIDIIEER